MGDEAVSWAEWDMSNKIVAQGTDLPFGSPNRYSERLRPGHALVITRYNADGYARTEVYYVNGRKF